MRRAVMQDLARLDTDVGAEEVALDDVTKKYHALVASQQAAVRSQRRAGTVLSEVPGSLMSQLRCSVSDLLTCVCV